MTVYLDTEDLLQLVRDLEVGPVRDLGLLDSAAHRPTSWVLGTEAYPNLHLKAAALLISTVSNRPLIDGNKLLGWLATAVFYHLNGANLEAPDDAAFDVVIAIAKSATESSTVVHAVAEHLAQWTIPSG